MKIRSGFISNSSSSSFILFKTYLTDEQIDHLKNYEEYALSDEYKQIVDSYNGEDKPQHWKEALEYMLNSNGTKTEKWVEEAKKRIENSPNYSFNDCSYYPEGWTVEETSDIINVSTFMNNFDMIFFCKMIGADVDKCGLMIEDEHCFTVGNNDARTDLKQYFTDDNYWDNYYDYWYNSKCYAEKVYPMRKEMFDKECLPSLTLPGGEVIYREKEKENV